MSIEELRAAVSALPLEEKRKFVEELCDELEEQEDRQPMPDWLFEECERRRKELEAHPERGIPGEQFFAELKARYGI